MLYDCVNPAAMEAKLLSSSDETAANKAPFPLGKDRSNLFKEICKLLYCLDPFTPGDIGDIVAITIYQS